jgi:hypothetical protein
MHCKACDNNREFIKVDHKYQSAIFHDDGVLEKEDPIPFRHVVEFFCARCKQLVAQSH